MKFPLYIMIFFLIMGVFIGLAILWIIYMIRLVLNKEMIQDNLLAVRRQIELQREANASLTSRMQENETESQITIEKVNTASGTPKASS